MKYNLIKLTFFLLGVVLMNSIMVTDKLEADQRHNLISRFPTELTPRDPFAPQIPLSVLNAKKETPVAPIKPPNPQPTRQTAVEHPSHSVPNQSGHPNNSTNNSSMNTHQVKPVTPPVEHPPMPKLQITGIIWDSPQPQAIVNGEIINIGDTVLNIKFVAIEKNLIKATYYDQPVTFNF